MDYNKAAQDYNTARLRFPTNLLAGILGFKEKAYFKAAPGAEQAPRVQFNFSATPAAPAPAK
jgi:LemA protein